MNMKSNWKNGPLIEIKFIKNFLALFHEIGHERLKLTKEIKQIIIIQNIQDTSFSIIRDSIIIGNGLSTTKEKLLQQHK